MWRSRGYEISAFFSHYFFIRNGWHSNIGEILFAFDALRISSTQILSKLASFRFLIAIQ